MFKTWYNFLKSSSDGCELTDRINRVKEYTYIQVVPKPGNINLKQKDVEVALTN
jgi:hypothetical protein